jgi:hypothetical protein
MKPVDHQAPFRLAMSHPKIGRAKFPYDLFGL